MNDEDITAVAEAAPVRQRRTLAAAVMIAATGLVLYVAVVVSFLWVIAAPFTLAGVYGTWTGLRNSEILDAVHGGMASDSSGATAGF